MKAVVMEIRDGKAVVLRRNGTFSQIRDNGYAVGQEIHISERHWTKCAAAAAGFILVIGGTLFGIAQNDAAKSPENTQYKYKITAGARKMKQTKDETPADASDIEAPVNTDGTSTASADINAPDSASISSVQPNAQADPVESADEQSDTKADDKTSEPAASPAVQAPEASEPQVEVAAVDDQSSEGSKAPAASSSHKKPVATASEDVAEGAEGRNEAVQSYTDYFGGTVEENSSKLQEASTDEILRAIEENKGTKDTTPESSESSDSQPSGTDSGSGESSSSSEGSSGSGQSSGASSDESKPADSTTSGSGASASGSSDSE